MISVSWRRLSFVLQHADLLSARFTALGPGKKNLCALYSSLIDNPHLRSGHNDDSLLKSKQSRNQPVGESAAEKVSEVSSVVRRDETLPPTFFERWWFPKKRADEIMYPLLQDILNNADYKGMYKELEMPEYLMSPWLYFTYLHVWLLLLPVAYHGNGKTLRFCLIRLMWFEVDQKRTAMGLPLWTRKKDMRNQNEVFRHLLVCMDRAYLQSDTELASLYYTFLINDHFPLKRDRSDPHIFKDASKVLPKLELLVQYARYHASYLHGLSYDQLFLRDGAKGLDWKPMSFFTGTENEKLDD